jgi:hypothetical protein
MSADRTTCTTTVAIADVEIAGASTAAAAVTHVAIEAHPAGAHGASHDLLAPVVSHAPDGMPDDASLAAAFDLCASCEALWLIRFAGASPIAAIASADIP